MDRIENSKVEENLEFTDEQVMRLDELENAAQEYLKIVTDKSDLPWNMEHIEKLNNLAADMMYRKGFKIYYPAIKTDLDGTQRKVDFYEPDNTFDSCRMVTLVLRDQDGLDERLTAISIRTALTDAEIVPAIMAASQDFLNTPEGRKVWEENCHNFNFGDFDLNVPNKFCIPHGFYHLSGAPDIMELDFNTQIVSLEDKEPAFILTLPFGNVKVANEDIDDIMDTAMYGCAYWCERAEPVGGYLGKYANEQISRDGALVFFPQYETEPVELTKEKFREGLSKWLMWLSDTSFYIENGWINPAQIDAEDADTILQYALFGELLYS